MALDLAAVRGFAICPECGCPLQRTAEGDLADGVAGHYKTVHPDKEPPS